MALPQAVSSAMLRSIFQESSHQDSQADGAAYDDGINYDGREAYSHHILEGELETIKDDACAEDSLAAKLDARYPGVGQVET